MTQETALEMMKTGANVFLTGEPGSGKTHTVSEYVKYLRRHGIEPAITASTGIAATHVGGMTIHAWSGVGIKRRLSEYDLDALLSREPLVRRVNSANVLVIDEISMLDATVLDAVDKALRALRRKEEAFGGLQVIFVGDFFQLPPIPEKKEGGERELPRFAFLARSWQDANPLVAYLSEQHRQDDGAFLSALSMIRSGELDESLGETFEEAMNPESIPDGVPLLYTHNVDVDAKNEEELAKLEGDLHEFVMLTRGKENVVELMKRGCLSPERLRLKEGAAVMFTKNDFERGYVNGSLGVVESFDEDDGLPLVRLRGGSLIKAEPEEWSVSDGDKKLATLSQVPLRLAWAITVHKSQGMSLDAAVMDLSRSFEYGQGYVALSRVRTLSGVFITGANRRAFEVHPYVLEKDSDMRARSTEAERYFKKMDESDLTTMKENFLTAIGGTTEEIEIAEDEGIEIGQKKKRGDTLLATRELFLAGRTTSEIAKERGIKRSTVLGHLDSLSEEGEMPLERLRAEIDDELFREIAKAFKSFEGTERYGKLAPVKDLLGNAADFDDIRLVRLVLS